jgi:hypothetical protein
MASTIFEFTITIPCKGDLVPLVHDVSGEMSRYVGLSESEARQAGALLTRLVTDRFEALGPGRGPISLRFERSSADEPVSVELTSPAAPGDEAWAKSVGGRHHRDGSLSRLRLEWRVTDEV